MVGTLTMESVMDMGKKKIPIGRKVLLWLGSVIIMATFAIYYFHAPLVPLVLGSLLALALTLMKHYSTKN